MRVKAEHLIVFTVDRFIGQQSKMLELLDRAKKVNLVKTKTAVSISKLIKLRLGDTFKVVIYIISDVWYKPTR